MAVQKNKKSPSKRGMRRSHDLLKNNSFIIENYLGVIHLRYNIDKNGYYRGKKIF